ncbi:MAG: 30S ribosomal protein S19 [Candidatus Wildermuthbacteria bacterium]|nr:30S ribosomal protein S19 [Candidatus Wildermuthbacteria bacterium]
MPRSLKKGPYVDARLMEKIQKLKAGDKQAVKTWARDCTITPEMIGFTFGVHNGKDFISVFITEDMVGHRLGEFSPTTKFVRHGGRMQKELEAGAQAAEEAKAAAASSGAVPQKPAPAANSEAKPVKGPVKK